ncbi:protein Abitram-like [Stegodyphus dumicola]|uniref:protein Abitram-like n=1 Tax=Stegodyphus dumicola TaxID=202533 RepID=UPI0015ACC846|nr:protein Abitram-like [Stegodyphus dumicola]
MERNLGFLQTCRIDPSRPSVTERYFKSKIIPETNQCILVHSNRLSIITLSPNHPILTENLDLLSINFDTVGNINRLSNKVSGKFKKGGQKLKEKSVLCSVKCSNNCEYTLYSCVSGTLIEVNERLIREPNILKKKPWSEGYIAIILPPFQSAEKLLKKNMC